MRPDAPVRFGSATALAWELAGCPRRETLPDAEPVPARCAACGSAVAESVPGKATVGASGFTNHDQLADRSSSRTCYACAWALSGKPPDTLRMWTVACAPGRDLGPSQEASAKVVASPGPGLLLTNRKDMTRVAALLASPPDGPWCVAVAESGQKHTLPWAPVNHGGGRWRVRVEAVTVTATPAQFAGVLGRSAILRDAGLTAEEVERLEPPPHRLTADVLPLWREHSRALAPWKGSALIHLANLCITKETRDHYLAAYRPA